MKSLIFILIFVSITLSGILFIENVYGDSRSYKIPIIISENKEYEFGEIIKEYRLPKDSKILKTVGYTTTGETYFLRVGDDFEHIMLFDHDGWHKAKMINKVITVLSPIEVVPIEVVPIEVVPKLDMIIKHDFTTHWKQYYDIYVKTYDLNVNSSPSIYPFEGKIDDAEVLVNILFEGEIIDTLNGVTKFGEWHGKRFFAENISMPGQYDIEIIVNYSGVIIEDNLEMFVIGSVPDSGTTRK